MTEQITKTAFELAQEVSEEFGVPTFPVKMIPLRADGTHYKRRERPADDKDVVKWDKQPLCDWGDAEKPEPLDCDGWDEANAVGVPMGWRSGMIAIDIDDHKPAYEGAGWLAGHGIDDPEMVETRVHQTASNGLHLIFAAEGDYAQIGNNAPKAHGIDIRGSGGFIVWGDVTGRYDHLHNIAPASLPKSIGDELLALKSEGGEVVRDGDIPEPDPKNIRGDLEERLTLALATSMKLRQWFENPYTVDDDNGGQREDRSDGDWAVAGELLKLGFNYDERFYVLFDHYQHGKAYQEGDRRQGKRAAHKVGVTRESCSSAAQVNDLVAKAKKQAKKMSSVKLPEQTDDVRQVGEHQPEGVQQVADHQSEAVDDKLADTPPSRFRFRSMEEVRTSEPPDFLIDDVMFQQGLVVLYGEYGAGKTFLGVDMAASIATGTPWFGHEIVETCPVVYVALEGGYGLDERLNAYEKAHGINLDKDAITVVDGPLLVAEQAAVLDFLTELELRVPKGAVVFVDTLARAMGGTNENTAEDMGAAIAAAQAIEKVTEGPVVLVHHPGKDASKGLRGSYALPAAADTVIKITRENGDSRKWSVEKQKDAPEGTSGRFTLKGVNLGPHPKRPCKMRNSAVIQPITYADVEKQMASARGLLATQIVVAMGSDLKGEYTGKVLSALASDPQTLWTAGDLNEVANVACGKEKVGRVTNTVKSRRLRATDALIEADLLIETTDVDGEATYELADLAAVLERVTGGSEEGVEGGENG